jgi:monothiol glutaredoxin
MHASLQLATKASRIQRFAQHSRIIPTLRQTPALVSNTSRVFLHSTPARAASKISSDDAETHSDFKPISKSKVHHEPDYAALVQKQVSTNPIFLYMKGTPAMPRCGFSKQVAAILQHHGAKFASCDVTENDFAICDAVEAYSGRNSGQTWTTFPQLYVSGELVGGCDIVTEMHNNDELDEVLKSAKAVTAA